MRLRIPASMVPAALRRLAVVAALLVATTAYGKTPDATSVVQRYGRLPVSFVENRGQTDPRVAFQAQAGDVALFFTRDGHSMRVARRDGEKTIAHVIRVELVDAATQKVEGRDATRATVSYFTGERDRWHAGIPTHGRIAYVQPWPGVDLEYRGQGGNLESVYVVAAHADASKIRLRYSSCARARRCCSSRSTDDASRSPDATASSTPTRSCSTSPTTTTTTNSSSIRR
jgi:hypothetical protein